ncbi:MAG: hypothetical protein M9909_06330 [Thermomicrobiales bacterium]|nr:hypothetical protein [Thermomicrobiales bacterium]
MISRAVGLDGGGSDIGHWMGDDIDGRELAEFTPGSGRGCGIDLDQITGLGRRWCAFQATDVT